MLVSRSLLSDDVIVNKILEMQVKYLDTLYSSNNLSTDWLIQNNQEEYSKAEDPEKQQALIKNVEELKENQVKRLRNAEYYKSQIEFLQSILAMKPKKWYEFWRIEPTFEINTDLKELVI